MTDVEIEKESELGDLESKGCSGPLYSRKLLSREERLSAIILKAEDLLTKGPLCIFKSPSILGKKIFADISCLQK